MKITLAIIYLLMLVLFSAVGFAQMGGMMGGYEKKSYSSNGERIYYTGVSDRTGPIKFQGGPMWLQMHGGGCVICHGVTGRGGVPVMMGTALPADIRYKALTSEDHHKGGEKEEHSPYTDELIKRAITKGLDSEDKPLDLTMPRWDMTKEELDDVIEYLKTLK